MIFTPMQHRIAAIVTVFIVLFMAGVPSAYAASSWSPTLLVNTESFQTIDSGDGSTNIELRFGNGAVKIFYNVGSTRFEFTKPVWVQGSLTATGSITTKTTLSGTTLRISGNADVQGALTASGSVRTDGDLTINDDAGAVDASLTFGNNTANQTLKYLNSNQKFQFSKGISVLGNISGSSLQIDGAAAVTGSLTVRGNIKGKSNISGSTLTVDGNVNIRGLNYAFPTTRGAANTFLKEDGAGNLTWGATSVGNGSGEIMSLHPEYPNATFFSSGSTYIGQLTMSGGTSALENSYQWTSTKSALNDYWISVRVRLPDNFSGWDPVKPIEFRYKTGVAGATNNHLTVRMRDTAGALVSLTGGAGLAGAAWATANITGPESAGTWTPKSYFTVFVKFASSSAANAAANAGFLNLNIETTTP